MSNEKSQAAEKAIEKLRSAVARSTIGLKVWFPKDDYNKLVLTGKITFEEFVIARIMI
jgi:hypothetical protein